MLGISIGLKPNVALKWILHSRLLRMALLLGLCFIVILKCGATPATAQTDGTEARELSAEEKLNGPDQDLMTGQEKDRSRPKREIVGTVISRAAVHGIEDSRTVIAAGTYPDGKLCWNGQEPFTAAETKAYRKFYLAEKGKMNQVNILEGKYLDPIGLNKVARDEYSVSCESRKCRFDPKTASFICGNATKKELIPDGKICYDGSEPPGTKDPGKDVPDEQKLNQQATKLYGKYCESGKCHLQLKRERSYICSSTLAQPIFILLLTLLGLSVFPNLQ